jgi:hypothetical protein
MRLPRVLSGMLWWMLVGPSHVFRLSHGSEVKFFGETVREHAQNIAIFKKIFFRERLGL